MIELLDPLTRRRRFHAGVNAVSASWLHQMTCVDQQRHVAVVVCHGAGAEQRIVAEGRYVVETGDASAAEFAVLVADDWQRRGIGQFTLSQLMGTARSRGVRRLHGEVMEDNMPMLAMVSQLAFDVEREGMGRGLCRAEMRWARPVPSRPGPLVWLNKMMGGRLRAA
jgi:acetyltransferase